MNHSHGDVASLPEKAEEGDVCFYADRIHFYRNGEWCKWRTVSEIPAKINSIVAEDGGSFYVTPACLLEPDIKRTEPFDFGEVDYLPIAYGVVGAELIPGDTCWYSKVPWKVDAACKWDLDNKTDIPEPEDSTKNNGGTTSYYDVPEGAKTLNDLIEHKRMLPWQHEVMKACYALRERAAKATDGSSSEIREINKIIYYANRGLELARKQD